MPYPHKPVKVGGGPREEERGDCAARVSILYFFLGARGLPRSSSAIPFPEAMLRRARATRAKNRRSLSKRYSNHSSSEANPMSTPSGKEHPLQNPPVYRRDSRHLQPPMTAVCLSVATQEGLTQPPWRSS